MYTQTLLCFTDIIISMLNIVHGRLCIVEKIGGIVLSFFSVTEVLQMGKRGKNGNSNKQAKCI